jgi:CRP-like cAMP-binding protein
VLRFVRDRQLDTLLLTNPLFTVLPQVERRALARRFEFLQLDRGSCVIEQDAQAPGVFVLLCGSVEVARHEAGKAHRLELLHAGGVFGEMSLLDGVPAMAEVRCVSAGFALLLPEPEFRAVSSAHPEVLDFLTLLAASRRGQYQALLAAVTAPENPSPERAGT